MTLSLSFTSSSFAVLFSSDRSSSGKSTFTLAFSSFVKERGIPVSLFKIGPDFIDPIVLGTACNCNVANLDPFLIPKNRLNDLFQHSSSCDNGVYGDKIINVDNSGNNGDSREDGDNNKAFIIEGAMGLYDGNSYIIAERFKLPVVLVMDASRISSTMASLVYGLKNYKKGVIISGVILNNISSERHYQLIASEIKKNIKDVKVFGYIAADGKNIAIKERHLGLATPGYFSSEKEFKEKIKKIKNLVMKNIDADLLIKTLMKDSTSFLSILKTNKNDNKKTAAEAGKSKINRSKKVKIAVAYDNAFLFYYKFNFEIFKKFNAEIIFFSPIKDKSIPSGVKALYIGGGYPELYAKELSCNVNMKHEIYKFYKNNGLIFAECGGLMYLSKKLIYKSMQYDFLDILPFVSTMDGTKLKLGYRTVYLSKDSFLGEANLKINGHEFHYSEILNDNQNIINYNINSDNYNNKIGNTANCGKNNFSFEYLHSGIHVESVFAVKNVSSNSLTRCKIDEGYRILNAIGTYVHVSFFSNQKIARNFIESAKKLSL
ncbi:MAG: cobyrinate a,c-diamide synthase [Candidatus Acididesulfobacter guangdongensis]|uniref:Cobyrinate a,c-diamide synthase n=1 Tax=Acididesulfobacter guangdongensis TaxID=2597225 RepID=A0A519BGW8_ACIG2|nr:MAG: cobyrinate a,c-diamide synthase [Candidatus Acididesulfobacter guangdongensis]